MGKESKIIGNFGEDYVSNYLRGLNWRIIGKNFRSNHGEIDIIAKDGDCLVFVEVKSYSFRSFYKPIFSITAYKKKSIIHAAKVYLLKNMIKNTICRFDVITIYKDFEGEEKLEHFKNAFEIN